MRAIDRPLIRLQLCCPGDPGAAEVDDPAVVVDQLELVRVRVLPRFVTWCEWLGLRVRTGRCPPTATARAQTLELRLPVRARSPRIGLADQIFADLCAAVAASRPDHFALVLPLPRPLAPDLPEPGSTSGSAPSIASEGGPCASPGDLEGKDRPPPPWRPGSTR